MKNDVKMLWCSWPIINTSSKQGYDMSVKLRPLAPGDLVLRKVVGNTRNLAWGKLGLNWEGSYRITSMAGVGAYYLEDLDERTILHPWNVNNLKMYYYC